MSAEPEIPKVEVPKLEESVTEDTPAPTTDDQNNQTPQVIDVEKLQHEFQESAKRYLVEQTAQVIVPSFAKWFDLSKIHDIEKKSLPDFFVEDGSGYKSSQDYKYIRDFIVNTFRLNPKEYLTITAVRRNLSGDVTNIIRIHQFLEQWGLINYQIDPKTKSSVLGPQYTGHFQITLDAPQGLVPFVPENAELTKAIPSNVTKTDDLNNENIPTAKENELPLNLEIRRNVYATGEKKTNYKTNNIVHYSCSICGKDTTEVRYHNLKIKSYMYNPTSTINNASVLCEICYDQGLFPSSFHSSDFIQLKKTEEGEKWSEQEILLLLEGIEMFGTYEPPSSTGPVNVNANLNNQWDKISEHVATKTREQCIIKFIQLPIEDKFLTKLIKEENEKDTTKSVVSQSLVQDIAAKLISTTEGREFISQNAEENLKHAQLEQTNLVNQVIELTLEKFNLKLKKIDELQANLLKYENQLNLERKQILLERWVQFEKISKLKESNPELSTVLDDLLKPVKINEIHKSVKQSNQTENGDDKMDVDESSNENDDNTSKLPVSVKEPKAYQFWSG
ncbi:SWIRM domain family protein [Candida albicans]|uniref:SWIRM domain family protein n=1 Tax=Candida albicans TaxID=5476 RepID=A0A8H6F4H9_CANAX|nr:SWIRM domain family protein [Candida albicans]KGR23044.1 chromatin structure-remodeling complex subunit RSC8 [Candida albicans P37037]KGU16978.1 chromatin structure-remodeling complex subunit RSC8 [Candida albicans 19F]KHC60710.1 chromatin structure-remodeling complex subunit RSC8 [Candida albicans P37039]